MDEHKITLSINPIYKCNFRCSFCYLTEQQLSDGTYLPLEILKHRLAQLKDSGYLVDHVDLYGGEIALLPADYLKEMDQILYDHADPSINIITNLSFVHEFFNEEHIELSVSFDFDCREKHEKVLSNIISLTKPVSILMLASPQLMSKDIGEMIETFNMITNIQSVEIKPYSSNQANQLGSSDLQFEEFVKEWINYPGEKRFSFINEKVINESLDKTRNAYSDDHIYLTPHGKFAVLEFDSKDDEYFLEMETPEEYTAWAAKEKEKVQLNSFCNLCRHQGHCLTEHYRDVKSLEYSCNGFSKLLDWYELAYPSSNVDSTEASSQWT